jgi:hypothetical protein
VETIMQAIAQSQLVRPPLKPDCLVWYAGDPCDALIQQYHQATEQRQQQEWQISVTAPMQKQIADQQKQVADQQKQIADQQSQLKTLQLKIESQRLEALQSEARSQVLLHGVGAGMGAAMAFVVVVAGFRRLARNSTASHREPERAASANA